MKQTQKVPDALLDAIGEPVPPGTVQRAKGTRVQAMPERRNRPVHIARPGLEGWACDDERCGTTGIGGEALLAHFDATGHRLFTAAETP